MSLAATSSSESCEIMEQGRQYNENNQLFSNETSATRRSASTSVAAMIQDEEGAAPPLKEQTPPPNTESTNGRNNGRTTGAKIDCNTEIRGEDSQPHWIDPDGMEEIRINTSNCLPTSRSPIAAPFVTTTAAVVTPPPPQLCSSRQEQQANIFQKNYNDNDSIIVVEDEYQDESLVVSYIGDVDEVESQQFPLEKLGKHSEKRNESASTTTAATTHLVSPSTSLSSSSSSTSVPPSIVLGSSSNPKQVQYSYSGTATKEEEDEQEIQRKRFLLLLQSRQCHSTTTVPNQGRPQTPVSLQSTASKKSAPKPRATPSQSQQPSSRRRRPASTPTVPSTPKKSTTPTLQPQRGHRMTAEEGQLRARARVLLRSKLQQQEDRLGSSSRSLAASSVASAGTRSSQAARRIAASSPLLFHPPTYPTPSRRPLTVPQGPNLRTAQRTEQRTKSISSDRPTKNIPARTTSTNRTNLPRPTKPNRALPKKQPPQRCKSPASFCDNADALLSDVLGEGENRSGRPSHHWTPSRAFTTHKSDKPPTVPHGPNLRTSRRVVDRTLHLQYDRRCYKPPSSMVTPGRRSVTSQSPRPVTVPQGPKLHTAQRQQQRHENQKLRQEQQQQQQKQELQSRKSHVRSPSSPHGPPLPPAVVRKSTKPLTIPQGPRLRLQSKYGAKVAPTTTNELGDLPLSLVCSTPTKSRSSPHNNRRNSPSSASPQQSPSSSSLPSSPASTHQNQAKNNSTPSRRPIMQRPFMHGIVEEEIVFN